MAQCPMCKEDHGARGQPCAHEGKSREEEPPARAKGDAPTQASAPRPTASDPNAPTAFLAQSGTSSEIPISYELDAEPAESASAEASELLLPGTKVGEYEISGVIGKGGMGAVYAATHPVIGKKVAIKVLSIRLSQSAYISKLFVQEARAVNKIGHPNIVDIFAFGRLPDGRHYFVMEYLSGLTLNERMKAGPTISYDEAFAALLHVCEALAAAHTAGIVHRDLKPDNIFLAENRGKRVAKLLDFGIAKLLHEAPDERQTRTGFAVGTPTYMSPEQCQGKKVDTRTDIYSLGVIMFTVFTGQKPFAGASDLDVFNGHVRTPPPRPSWYVDLPPALEALILKCLEKDPARRPQTLQEVKQALEGIAATMGLSTEQLRSGIQPSASGIEIIRKASRRRRSRWMMLALLGAALAAALALFGLQWMRTRSAPTLVATPVETEIRLQVITDPPGAHVFINGKPQALLSPHIFKLPRAPELVVRLEKEGRAPAERVVEYGPHAVEQVVYVALEPERPPRGELEVRTAAPRARWQLDGKPVGDGTGTLHLPEVEPGLHRIAVEASGFEIREEPVEVKPGGTASLEWELQAKASPRPPAKKGRSEGRPTQRKSTGGDDNELGGWQE